MSKLVPPHGGEELKPLIFPQVERAEERKRAEGLKKIPMSSREVSDVIMMAMGAYSPLDGFMGHDHWHQVCLEMRMGNGLFWPIPITLSCDTDLAESIHIEEEVALVDTESGDIMGLMKVLDKYTIDREAECKFVYRTADPEHPGVQNVLAQGEVNLGGRVMALAEGTYPDKYPDLFIRPAKSRALFAEKGWSSVAAFQTRSPMYRSHEHLAKIAIEVTDGVFIHQVLGKLKPGEIPAEIRTQTIQAVVDNYFVPGTVILAGYPIEMRYAGPREALFHALIRQNFGCSHLVVGRDHAGVGDYYGPFDAQHVFDTLWEGALEIHPLKIDTTFYCKKCDGMATAKTCPHGDVDRVSISRSLVPGMLLAGDDIPTKVSRPEVAALLKDYYASLS
jgi:sulfate adenylyltransferase